MLHMQILGDFCEVLLSVIYRIHGSVIKPDKSIFETDTPMSAWLSNSNRCHALGNCGYDSAARLPACKIMAIMLSMPAQLGCTIDSFWGVHSLHAIAVEVKCE